ncbi:hypothetical protein BPNPMPFG_005461 [Mesorhizobium sp. AR07]|uniref:hypothetical protein n=1 Tax=Mesorhizobium sp. AR07 TaxID=2865838 RepID=UPI002160173B|nr:hypothetical protein [Mesorhizobium sp. AR07]UVK43646.1 hypothetical protein BPNPMPFG_005461 [Mesorhizobium sp. AR07]
MKNKQEPVVPVEFAGVSFSVHEMPNGRFRIDLEGQAIPSLPGVAYGLGVRAGARKEQVEKLRDLLEELCPEYYAGFLDRVNDEEFQDWMMEGYDIAGYLNPGRPLGPGDELGRDPFAYDSQ